MLSTSSKKSWISEKIAYIVTNPVSIKPIVSTVLTGVKLLGLASRGRVDCAQRLGSTRMNVANIQMSGDQNWTIIKGVLKSFLMVYEEALLGNDLEGGGSK
jgi:hypothetical protein